MMLFLTFIRWTVTALLGSFFLLGTTLHYRMAWLQIVKKEHSPSGVAPIPALAGVIALAVCPIKNASHLFWLPIFIDVFGLWLFIGGVPNLVHAFVLTSWVTLLAEYKGVDLEGNAVTLRLCRQNRWMATWEAKEIKIGEACGLSIGGSWQLKNGILHLKTDSADAAYKCQNNDEDIRRCSGLEWLSAAPTYPKWLAGISWHKKQLRRGIK